MHYWFYGGHMVWMVISWLVGIGLLFMLIWLSIAAISGRNNPSGSSPEEILRRRYAAGEINTDEYEQRLEKLRKTKGAA